MNKEQIEQFKARFKTTTEAHAEHFWAEKHYQAITSLRHYDIIDVGEARQLLGIELPDEEKAEVELATDNWTASSKDEHPNDCRGCRHLHIDDKQPSKFLPTLHYWVYECYHPSSSGIHIVWRDFADDTAPQPSWFPGVPEDCKEVRA